MTERLYDNGSCLTFTATVLSCTPDGDAWAIELDRTAFFPGGGGQAADSGWLGENPVIGMREVGGTILHLLGRPLTVGETVRGEIEAEPRLRRMQSHSGEHILSGLFWREHGLSNIGFHMGNEDVTLDLDGQLDREQLLRIEKMANLIIARNLPITVSYPTPDALAALDYRSKLDLTENVRIVSIGEAGEIDRCACCAPHVTRTGEIGMIKMLDFIHYKGGLRIHMLCGLDALEDYHRKYCAVSSIANALSVKPGQVVDAVARLEEEISVGKAERSALCGRLIDLHTAALPGQDNVILCEPLFTPNELRRLANAALERVKTVLAIAGDDAGGYFYILGSSAIDCRAMSRELHAALGGKGGGSSTMTQGHIPAAQSAITAWWAGTH